MATLYTHKASNIRKTFLLMSGFLIFIIAIGWFASYYWASPNILYIAVGISVFMNIIAYWKSDSIALSMSKAQELKRDQAIELFRIIENLSITAGLPMPRVYIIPGEQINAFATGRDPKHAAIAVTQGALRKLDKTELEGVLAHELSHVGNRDILVSTVAVVLAGVISIVADIFMRASFFGGGRRNNNNGGGIMAIVGLVAIILAPIAATLIRLAISRQRENLADASGSLLTRYPEGLASALEKIAQDETPMTQAKNATAHLFLANPFKGKESQSWFAKLFMTHPPLEERIKRLRDLKI